MRKSKKETYEQNLYNLDGYDREILKLVMQYPDIKKSEIAREVGLTERAVYLHLGKPAVKRLLKDINKNLIELIKETQDQAARRLRDLLKSTNEKIAIEACRLALQPFLNQATVHVNSVDKRVYTVQFGEDGQMFKDVVDLDGEGNPLLTAKDLVDGSEFQN